MTNKEDQIKRILYGAFKNMEYRCNKPDHEFYERYGGRGIGICEEWREFENFYEWSINNRHKKGLTLERLDNDGDYSPENCAWVSMAEQNNNRKGILSITIDGITKNAYEWCRVYDLNYGTFLNRRNALGWDDIKAIRAPVQIRKNPKGFEERIQ